MPSRMEKYNNNKVSTTKSSRTKKNEELYQNLYSNSKYIEFNEENINDSNLAITSLKEANKSYVTREDYHKAREFEDIIDIPKRYHEEISNDLTEEDRNYDINSIILEAKKNREENDELEKRRKLKNTQYNILANLDPSKIEEYQKQKYLEDVKEKEEIQKLIDTITSKNLVKEIKDKENEDLLNDLMPTNINETIITESISKQILDKDFKDPSNLSNMDTSFYSKSMDFSPKDFEQEMVDDFRDDVNGNDTIIKVIITITIIAVLVVGAYFIIKNLL